MLKKGLLGVYFSLLAHVALAEQPANIVFWEAFDNKMYFVVKTDLQARPEHFELRILAGESTPTVVLLDQRDFQMTEGHQYLELVIDFPGVAAKNRDLNLRIQNELNPTFKELRQELRFNVPQPGGTVTFGFQINTPTLEDRTRANSFITSWSKGGGSLLTTGDEGGQEFIGFIEGTVPQMFQFAEAPFQKEPIDLERFEIDAGTTLDHCAN